MHIQIVVIKFFGQSKLDEKKTNDQKLIKFNNMFKKTTNKTRI